MESFVEGPFLVLQGNLSSDVVDSVKIHTGKEENKIRLERALGKMVHSSRVPLMVQSQNC